MNSKFSQKIIFKREEIPHLFIHHETIDFISLFYYRVQHRFWRRKAKRQRRNGGRFIILRRKKTGQTIPMALFI